MAEGKYYYDAGVNSTSLKENWHTPWGIGGTQFVLGTNQWVDARSFSAIDRDPDATEADKEEELMVFPGTLFKIDHARKYKSTKIGIDKKRIAQDVIWGREATLDAQKGVNVMSPAGLKWEYKGDSVPIAVDLISKHVNGRRDDRAIDEYSSRFSEMGDTLYHWLYHK
jgi:chloramphenicol 3-O-phosphotransferase